MARRVPPHGAVASLPTYTARPGCLSPPGTGLVVPATLYLMRGPRSYTRQDVVEFHVGSWPAVLPLLVAGLAAAGARPAAPGEFTFRALLNGRIDLAQAEAVMAVIGAASAASLRAAEDLLAGHLSREVARLDDRVREVLALVEVDLDFSDQDIAFTPPAEIAARLAALRDDLAALGRRCRGLETFTGEVRLVLAGRPNAGKSSLFNRLLAADRAIVSPVAGTTRDELRATLHAEGLTFTLGDVAGLDDRGGCGDQPRHEDVKGTAPADLAAAAQAKAVEAIGRADLVILAVDATAPSYDRLDDLLSLVAAPLVVAVTKCDLAPPDRVREHLVSRGFVAEIIATSAATGQGIEELRAALVRAVEGGTVDRQAAGPVVTARSRAAMEQAAAALARAEHAARRPDAAGELVALELREADDALASILGRAAGADVLSEIFARFCIGK